MSDFPDWISMDITGRELLTTAVTRVKSPDVEGHGTGFYYGTENQTYLVTNQHVVNGHETIRVYLRNDDNSMEGHDISLEDGKGEDWHVHPKYSGADVCVIPLHPVLSPLTDKSPLTTSRCFTSDFLLKGDDRNRVSMGDPLMIIGFPGNFKDQYGDFPVVRAAMLSTPFGYPYNGQSVFLTDARMHPGTGGSPVIAGSQTLRHTQGTISFGPEIGLLGIHSATLGDLDLERPHLDLNAAWYAELVEETIDSLQT